MKILEGTQAIIAGILILPFLIVGGIFTIILAVVKPQYSNCPHWRECPWYSKESETCNEEFGMYSYDKLSGCCIKLNEKKEELKKIGKKLRRLR